jgi:hypothetical protein
MRSFKSFKLFNRFPTFNSPAFFEVAQDRLSSPRFRLCRHVTNCLGVMLNEAKHLAFPATYESRFFGYASE